VAALLLHLMLFLFFPRLDGGEVPDFEPPLYVSFDPAPQELVEVEEESPEPPPPSREDPPEPAPRQPEETEAVEPPPPPPEEIVVPPARSPEERPVPSEPAPQPAPESPAPAEEGPTQPAPTTPSVEQTRPEPAPSTADADADADAEPEPQPAPSYVPPQKQGRPSAATTPATTTETSEWDASQLDQIVAIQEEYLRELEEYEARQQALLDDTSDGSTSTDQAQESPDSAPRFADFQDALSRMISGIESADNVVRTTPDDSSATTGTTSSQDANGPGIDGVTVGEGTGQRQLVAGSSPDLSSVELPAGFPPEYLVVVDFTVAGNGAVTWAAPRRPTPVPQLDSVLSAAVRSWQFQPAPSGGSSSVRGSVTIVVDTRGGN
jgi:TonB family protein